MCSTLAVCIESFTNVSVAESKPMSSTSAVGVVSAWSGVSGASSPSPQATTRSSTAANETTATTDFMLTLRLAYGIVAQGRGIAPLTPAPPRRKIAAALTLEPLTLAARVGTYDPAQPWPKKISMPPAVV